MSTPEPRRPDGEEAPDQLPSGLDRDAVVALLRDRRQPEARLALKTLSLRFPDLAEAQARSIVADRGTPEALRAVAATELGYHVGPDNERELVRALRDAPPTVLKHVARSLGRIGGADALAALERATGPAASSPALRFARALIAYRLGRDDHRIDPREIAAVTEPIDAEPTPLELRDVPESAVEAVRDAITRELPATPVAARGSVRFRCGNSLHWVLLAQELGDDPAQRLARAPMVAGVVLKFRECPGHWSLDEYLLTNGGGTGVVDLVGVRDSGIVVHAGSVRVDGAAVSFELGANNPPYSRPLELGGVVEQVTGSIAFRRAVVGRSRGALGRTRTPQRLEVVPD